MTDNGYRSWQMGTLFEQQPRDQKLTSVDEYCRRMFGEKDEYTPDEWRAAIEMAKYRLAVQSADVLDEQLAGFAELAIRLIEAVDRISEAALFANGEHNPIAMAIRDHG